ncbi:hypothetical protein PHYSODRAFT_499651 [Phytophthora sojae]|uniref:Cyclic nucleotide-binding domain-containing protein n=1 Tax=Phytophthora sojae (strain P6497) TaxID=1094619 RepID=G4ZDR5_PHYSP|nr:hypothetical protein PHYSODRAFT_499651 [Phytophthora sojae]EGZ18994.1 hypothetical protein PHYSODRAFT_499651 [Phytophthora sojae]|eukprot:XP_009528052.1 hypothetical protein PHYSODRAFT_499651 [Phytophthora sojae]
MEAPIAAFDISEADREEYAGKKASLALQRALNGAGAWMVTTVRDQRKCDHALLPAEMPASIREKVARILQDRGVKEQVPAEAPDPKAPWHQQLEQHVARLMQQMRGQPHQFRQMLLMAASDPSADCVVTSSSSQAFVDSRRAYRRLRRAAMALGEEIYHLVRAFVRRSEANGVLPQEAQAVRLASLYKLELRRHVTISAVMECIHQADSEPCHPLLRRKVKSAGITSRRPSDLDVALSPRAASAPTEAPGRGSQNQQTAEPDKVKSVHAFKLQALERLLAKTWQGSRSASMRSLQAAPVTPAKLSDETLTQIQERVTAFLYHRSRENYPLWSEPPLSREETVRHLRTFVATLLTTPLLQSLSIEQLLEVSRAARWQMLAPGDTLCVRNTEIDSLIVVMDGSLTSTTASESPSGPNSPPPSGGVVIPAPACLGELGMVRNAERWPRTLAAQSSEGAKALILPKLTFEALLHRFFNVSKALPPALAAVANLLQPRRPSSSPAVVARRLARTFRNSLSARRPSTAAPTTATEINIARWHEVRDEKLRDYRAGVEAEQRAAALEALQRAMEDLSSECAENDDRDFLQDASAQSPQKIPWSRHEYYPNYDPESVEEVPTAPESATDVADQLREFYRSLNARRSVMRARLASAVPSDQMVQQSPERKKTEASQLESPSKNQVEDSRATEARKSALNIMLTRQSTATMARHSKLLDKDAAQQVLIQKHFADSSAGGGPLGSASPGRPQSGRPQSGHHSETSTSEPNPSHSQAPLPLRADLQRRLDSVLNDLLMPPKNKLDLVLRYTQADEYDKFPMAVQLWERVQTTVSWRERVMKSLWDFEMFASDPRRHFRSISTHRLREEKERDALFSKLNQASNACVEAMDELFRCCGDTVCLGDRPYRDKMKKDYTELLFEVEQERLRIIYDGVRPHEHADTDVHSPNLEVEGDNADPNSTRHRLATPRESIFVPVASLDNKPEPTAPFKPGQHHIRRASRVTVQVQQQRQAELDALTKQTEEKLIEPSIALAPSTQIVRPAEKTFVAPAADAMKSAARSKQQQERASLRELFQQFITRSIK